MENKRQKTFEKTPEQIVKLGNNTNFSAFLMHLVIAKKFIYLVLLIVVSLLIWFTLGSRVAPIHEAQEIVINSGMPTESSKKQVEKKEKTPHTEVVEENIINTDVDILMAELAKEPQGASLYEALLDYEKVIATGSGINKVEEGNLVYIERKLFQERNKKIRCNLLIAKGVTEYAIGNYNYYRHPENYWIGTIGNYKKAIKSFDEAIKVSENALSHRYIGVIMLDMGDSYTDKAIIELKKSIALNNHDDRAFYKLGNAYGDVSEHELAISSYLSGLAINNTRELMKLNLGLAYFENKDRSNGYKTFIELTKTCIEYCNIANYNLADSYSEEIGAALDNTKILAHLDAAINAASKKGEAYRAAYSKKGILLYELGRKEEAVEVLQHSLNDPKDRKMGDNMFNQNSNEKYSYYILCKAYISLGDYDKARFYLKKALKSYPNEYSFTVLLDSIE